MAGKTKANGGGGRKSRPVSTSQLNAPSEPTFAQNLSSSSAFSAKRAKTALQGSSEERAGGSKAIQRYTEAGTSASQRNMQNGTAAGMNGMVTGPDDVGLLTDDQANLDATIDDLEEPTLGQKLRSLRVGVRENGHIEDGEEDVEKDDDDDDDGQPRAMLPMGSLSLAQTLTQALHSNDAALLSSCLAHSDPAVIRSSVTRLSGPLAVKLLEHSVDRMGRGGKRSSGALGSARTRGIIEWVRATLIAHTGYLMSLPKLVHRLSALHSTLSSRLASHERLLALNGRLELVLGQIEMRAAYTAQQAVKLQGVKTKSLHSQSADQGAKKKQQLEGKQWIEESSSEEEDEDPEEMDVDQDEDDDDDDDDDDGEEEEEESDDADGLADVVRGEEEGETQDIALGNDTLGNTSLDSEEGKEDEAAGKGSSEEEEGESSMGNDDVDEEEEEESDESALDEEGDSDEVEEEEEDDSEEEDITRGGLLDMEAESTDGDEESEEGEEE